MTPHVCVCICTYKRPEMLRRLLHCVREQRTDGRFTFSVVVVDNDREGSARSVADGANYAIEPQQNIALARNRACALAEGSFLAWIDDDEFPANDWLLRMLDTCESRNVAGVLGPVVPHYEQEPPKWIVKGRFHDRPRHETGFQLGWQEARTGNVLIRKRVVDEMGVPFRPEFPNGGEDQDFFQRAMAKGHVFVWCDEGAVSETVAPSRWSRRVMLKRALLRGRNSIKHKSGRLKNLIKSLIAVPAYVISLPFLLLAGHHLFMRFMIKLCDHLGRLLAVLRLNPVSERPM